MKVNKEKEFSNPFGQEMVYRPRISLSMMLLLFAINAVLCCMILLAANVPTVSNAFSDTFGLPRSEPGKPNRTMHLVFLIVCYSAPLFITAVVSLVYHGLCLLMGPPQKRELSEPDSPFA